MCRAFVCLLLSLLLLLLLLLPLLLLLLLLLLFFFVCVCVACLRAWWCSRTDEEKYVHPREAGRRLKTAPAQVTVKLELYS